MGMGGNNGKNNANLARIAFIFSMGVFGTIGLFRRLIPLPSGAIAFFRGAIGTLALMFLPPHPIPQGHPSTPALSALSHASNLDW